VPSQARGSDHPMGRSATPAGLIHLDVRAGSSSRRRFGRTYVGSATPSRCCADWRADRRAPDAGAVVVEGSRAGSRRTRPHASGAHLRPRRFYRSLLLHIAGAIAVTLASAILLCIVAKPRLIAMRLRPDDYRWLGDPPRDWQHALLSRSLDDLVSYPSGWPPLNLPGVGSLVQHTGPETKMLEPPSSFVRRARGAAAARSAGGYRGFGGDPRLEEPACSLTGCLLFWGKITPRRRALAALSAARTPPTPQGRRSAL
jgi:hypothetical protein